MPRFQKILHMWSQLLRIQIRCTGQSGTIDIGSLSTGYLCQVHQSFAWQVTVVCFITLTCTFLDWYSQQLQLDLTG